MMNKLLLLSVFLASFWLSSIALPEASAQSSIAVPAQNAAPLEVIARNGAGREKHLFSENGVVPLVMVRPSQTVPVTLQFSAAMAGTPVAFAPLDGGRIGGGNGAVLPTGRTLFTFSPGAMPGRYRVAVYLPGQQYLLKFYVVDANHPPWPQRPGGGQ